LSSFFNFGYPAEIPSKSKMKQLYSFRNNTEEDEFEPKVTFTQMVIPFYLPLSDTKLIAQLRAELIEQTKKAITFAIKHNDFPTTPRVEAANIQRPAQNAALLPTIIESGYNAIAMMDDENVIQFHHRQRNGLINKHEGEGEQIGTDSFESYIQSNLSDGIAGPCWLPSCTAEIHPDEIKELVRLGQFPDVLYKRYKEAFNHLHQAGGASKNILQEATLAECVIFTKTRKSRKTRKTK
jgi:hypothetical protein